MKRYPAGKFCREVPTSGRRSSSSYEGSALDLHVHVAIAHFTWEDLCAFALTTAGSVLQTDVPAVPAADHFAGLHNALTQRKSEMRAEVLDGINAVIPAEKCDIESSDSDRVTETFRWQFRQAGSPRPFIVHAVMLYFRRRRNI
jgi:hypothetical protein